ncbi:DDE-type integrase/transposase/recombinase [Novosphingobium sp. KACC 22771]|uniref:DDE-type integrase/transposase/recombinase n=1 Tax=Novosphingobium sp. KACC 22771 TaxID=3025670 RepID=UPI0023669332|nr:DDE-type integrase/transposase/recombinase [Novosphingobium sp. KACC 22771]WDF73496.1 Mu transposase C-terminal domain-containing protein [Novosphingobium sp. KACC 22771]
MSAADNLWLTAQQLADLRLAGLPTTKRGINLRADTESWPWKPRVGVGGGKLYSVLGLPAAARDDLLARRSEALPASNRPVGRPKGTSYFDRNPDAADAVEAYLTARPVSARNLLKLLAADGFAELPTMRTLQRFVRDLEERKKVLFTALRDPDGYKSAYAPALGRMDATVSYAHEMWEIDTTKADVMCTDGRKAVLGIIDRWSRRARFLVVESESAQSVRRMLVTTITAWGVMPAILKTDNGSGFINATMETALPYLEIALDPCLPGTPEDKPHVERLFGTFMRERASLLDGFIGHNVAQAQKLRAAAKKKTGRAEIIASISSAELQAILDAWVDGEYHQRTHSSLKMSPMEKWQRSPTPPRAAAGERELKLALSAYVGTAMIGKRGVRWKNGRYWSPCFVEWMGKPVVLRRDEDDLGELFIFDGDGNYIDTAVNAERSGLSEQQFAMAAQRQMATYMSQAKAEVRAKQKQYSYEAARDKMLRDEAEAAGKLIHLPGPAVQHVSPTIASMADKPAPVAVQPGRLDEVMRKTQPAPTARTVPQKVAEADAILAAKARGEGVEAEALRRAELYAGSSEYRAHKMTFVEFPRSNPATPSRRQGAA